MAEAKKTIEIAYRIKSLEMIEVKLESPPTETEKFKEFGFSINILRRVVKETPKISLTIEIIIDGDKVRTLGSIKVAIDFAVQNFNSFHNPNTDKYSFPKQFYDDLNTVAISTVRGIMYSQFRGTHLHAAVLPLISSKNLKVDEKKNEIN